MPRAQPNVSSFNAGEISPNLAGRTDFDKYPHGCHKIENMIPLVQGPAERRPGTHYAASVKTPATRTWLMPFDFNVGQSYVIELGNLYARFYTNRAVLISAGVPYEIVSPFAAADLTNADGTFKPSIAQSNDILFMANEGYFPRVLERSAATSWAFRTFGLNGLLAGFKPSQWAFQWPFASFNIDAGKKIYASAATGAVNLTASTGVVFAAWMVGQLILMESDHGSAVVAWEPAKVRALNDIRRVDNRVYKCTTAGTTGTIRPTHTEGKRFDGDPGAEWQFQHAGFGVVQVDSVVDAAHATGTVVTELPSDVVGVGNTTARWQTSAWQTNAGFPAVVFFFGERLGFARGTQFWLSVAGDFFSFAERDNNGDVLADSAISATLASDTSDAIRWGRETAQGLLLGTDGGEFLVQPANTAEPLGPANIKAPKQSSFGARRMAPVSVQEAVLFVQRGGRKLREAVFSIDSEGVKSRDLTVLSDHITKSGIVAMAYQQEPNSTLWSARGDGMLLGFTYSREHEVNGWHRHPLGGTSAKVESVAVIPAPDGSQDDLWMIVQRIVNGAPVRFIEYLEVGIDDGDDIVNAWYADAALKYAGAPATVIAGLAHIKGETAAILADGAVVAPQAVNAFGEVTLATAASTVIVGLPNTAILIPERLDGGNPEGTAQGKTKRVDQIIARLKNTVGGKVGTTEDTVDELPFRDPSMAMNEAIQPFTGDKEIPSPSDYETDGRLVYVNDQPLPATVVAFMPRYTTQP